MIKMPILAKLDERGMTIVEVLVVVGLVLVVVGAGIAPYLTQQDFLKQQFTRNRLQDEVSIAMSYIMRDILRAKAAALSDQIDGSGTYRTLTLTVGTGPNRTDEVTTIYTRTTSNGMKVTRKVGSDPAVTIAYDIMTLAFSSTTNNHIEIAITSDDINGQQILMNSGASLRGTRAI